MPINARTMKRAYECVNLGYVPTAPAFVPIAPKRPRRDWRIADFAACFLLPDGTTQDVARSIGYLYAQYSQPMDGGYKSRDFHWIIAHAIFLFHSCKAQGHLGAVVCIAIAMKLHDDFSPDNKDDVYQRHLSDEDKRRFGAVESRVFLQDLNGYVMQSKQVVRRHLERCAAACNAPILTT